MRSLYLHLENKYCFYTIPCMYHFFPLLRRRRCPSQFGIALFCIIRNALPSCIRCNRKASFLSFSFLLPLSLFLSDVLRADNVRPWTPCCGMNGDKTGRHQHVVSGVEVWDSLVHLHISVSLLHVTYTGRGRTCIAVHTTKVDIDDIDLFFFSLFIG